MIKGKPVLLTPYKPPVVIRRHTKPIEMIINEHPPNYFDNHLQMKSFMPSVVTQPLPFYEN
jgi:hypothetical protein